MAEQGEQRHAITEDEVPVIPSTTPPPGRSGHDGAHPGFATTALGPGDVRDTPRVPSPMEDGEPDAWIGRVLSNVYRIEAKIGEGGMGAVYAARHVHLGKQYAVKVLTAQIANNKTAIERLKQEAIAASSIDHDNIVDVTNFDTAEDGSVFIVMEYLRGESLASRLGNGPIKLHDTLAIAQQISGALGAAHARGIVHRDLKPENVFLTKKGDVERVKVLDFGISKVKSAEAEGVRMTRTGQLVGTPLYMSPEQARGETDIDHRVDVYALGVMLYEMLAGVPPFDGRNYFELLWKHGNEKPEPIAARNPNVYVPDVLSAVVMRALAKERKERYQTMEELAQAMYAAVPEVPMGATSLPPSMPPTSDPSIRISVATPRAATDGGERKAVHTAMSSSDALRASQPKVDASTGSRRTMIVAGGSLIALVAVAAIFASMTSTPVETPAETPVVPPVALTPPVPVPDVVADPPVPLGVEPPASVTVSFGSTPSGADVRVAGETLCTTPCMHDLPRGEELTVLFHRDGFFDESARVTPEDGAPVEVRLRVRRHAESTTTGSPPIKTEI
jgi:serine/threonine protein kinase